MFSTKTKCSWPASPSLLLCRARRTVPQWKSISLWDQRRSGPFFDVESWLCAVIGAIIKQGIQIFLLQKKNRPRFAINSDEKWRRFERRCECLTSINKESNPPSTQSRFVTKQYAKGRTKDGGGKIELAQKQTLIIRRFLAGIKL